jgi:enoyl-CoA hydratase/carnithine racemase
VNTQENAEPSVRFAVDGQVATIVLDRPAKLNAVTPAMAAEVVAACRRCDADPAIRAVVLTGAGERAFSAGSDVAELDSYESAWAFRSRDDYCDAVRALRTPAICAVNGLAYGGGLELALSCDIRLAAPHATFAAPEIKLGWIGGGGMTYLLTHSIGASNAAQMVLTGDPVDAERALRMNLVSELVPLADLVARAQELAATIASRPPIAAQTGKANLRAAYAMPLEAAVQYERDLQTICFATDDAHEGRTAFKERRPGVFEGK